MHCYHPKWNDSASRAFTNDVEKARIAANHLAKQYCFLYSMIANHHWGFVASILSAAERPPIHVYTTYDADLRISGHITWMEIADQMGQLRDQLSDISASDPKQVLISAVQAIFLGQETGVFERLLADTLVPPVLSAPDDIELHSLRHRDYIITRVLAFSMYPAVPDHFQDTSHVRGGAEHESSASDDDDSEDDGGDSNPLDDIINSADTGVKIKQPTLQCV